MSHTFALPSLDVRSAFFIGGTIAFISGFLALTVGIPLFCATTAYGNFSVVLSSPIIISILSVMLIYIVGSSCGSAFSAWVFNRSIGYARHCGIAI